LKKRIPPEEALMRARGFLTFIILNILITAGVSYLVISQLGSPLAPSDQTRQFATVQIIITATPDPFATVPVRIITATPLPGQIAALPPGVLDTPSAADIAAGTAAVELQVTAAPTQDPSLSSDPELAATAAALPANCQLHRLASGESPGLLAQIYGVSMFDILDANGLTEDDARFLQIGQVLVIPLNGCPLIDQPIDLNATSSDATPTSADGTPTGPTLTPTPSLTPTVTLAPTAANAQVEIQEIVGAGDITTEAVILYNRGATVDLTGWTLRDLDGNVYTFPEGRLFNDSIIEVRTQVGQNTPVLKFWGLTRPVWGDLGDVVTLTDARGSIQATLRITNP
jgi:LysM repeat protein